MAKVMVEHPGEANRTPFLRGILVHSLQNAGLTFSDAHLVANTVRDELADTGEIGSAALKLSVIEMLKRLGFEDAVPVYVGRRSPYAIEVITLEGEVVNFSNQDYGNQLKAIGLRADEATAIVSRLSQHLLRRNAGPVSYLGLSRLTYRLLRLSKHLGPAVAKRWLIWRDFVHSGRPLVLLIGGTAGSGKSTLAADLASGLGITRTQSTDILREVMRTMSSAEELAMLHRSSFNAWTLLPESDQVQFTEQDDLVFEGFRLQSDAMALAIDAVIQRAEHEKVSLIMEGVHIRPAHVEKFVQSEDSFIFPVVLGVVKRKRLQQRIRGRSTQVPQRRAEHYLNHLDEIWTLQSGILSEADQYGVPIIVNDDRETVYREIMLAVIARLSLDFAKSPEEVFG
jgi:2-phosphoglycerate kinase